MATESIKQFDAQGRIFQSPYEIEGADRIPHYVQHGAGGTGGTTETLPTAFTTIQKTVGTTAVQLTATPTPVKSQPFIRPDPANTGVVVVITGSGKVLTDGMFVGDGVFVPVDDLSKIWLIASVASQKVSVIAGS